MSENDATNGLVSAEAKFDEAVQSVQASAARISAKSEAEFRRDLEQWAARRRMSAQAAIGGAKPIRVLLVDDDEQLLAACERDLLLTLPSCVVMKAASVDEANKIARRNEFDIAIIDLNLPDGTGMELATILRALDQHAMLPILMISGTTPEELPEVSTLVGAVGYLVKPFHLGDLARKTIDALSSRRADKEH